MEEKIAHIEATIEWQMRNISDEDILSDKFGIIGEKLI